MRIDPNANTRRPPSAAATKRASAKGTVPDHARKVILALRRFWNAKSRIIAKRTRDGNILTQALLARVDAITLPGLRGASRVGWAYSVVFNRPSSEGTDGDGDSSGIASI